jgi:hypothetical protein
VIKKIDNKHMATSGAYILIDTSNAYVIAEQYTRCWVDIGKGNSTSTKHPVSIHASLPLCVESSNGIYAIRPISAQTRLASPITKTSLNTMKIQYDFFFKIPLPYMPPEHVWDLYK